MLESVEYTAGSPSDVSEDKKRIVKNLYLSNIAEEFVAMQVDLEIPVVISILKELDVYRGKIDYDTYWIKREKILSIEGIPEELNLHRENFGKDASEVDYDGIGPCPICNSRIDEFNFCACGGNLGIS